MDSRDSDFYSRIREKLEKLDKMPTKKELKRMVTETILEITNATVLHYPSPVQTGVRTFLNIGHMKYGCR